MSKSVKIIPYRLPSGKFQLLLKTSSGIYGSPVDYASEEEMRKFKDLLNLSMDPEASDLEYPELRGEHLEIIKEARPHITNSLIFSLNRESEN